MTTRRTFLSFLGVTAAVPAAAVTISEPQPAERPAEQPLAQPDITKIRAQQMSDTVTRVIENGGSVLVFAVPAAGKGFTAWHPPHRERKAEFIELVQGWLSRRTS